MVPERAPLLAPRGPSQHIPPPSPVNPTAQGSPEITTRDAVAIAPAPMMPNAATIPLSPSAHVTATVQLDATTHSAPTASSAPDVPAAGNPKPSKRRSTWIAGESIFAIVDP